MNRRRRRSQQAKSIAKDLEYEAKVVVIGEEESVCTGRFFCFRIFEDFFCRRVRGTNIFPGCVVSNAIDVSNKNASGEKKNIMTCD